VFTMLWSSVVRFLFVAASRIPGCCWSGESGRLRTPGQGAHARDVFRGHKLPLEASLLPARPHLLGLWMVGHEARAVDVMLHPRRADPWNIAPSVTSDSEPCTP